MEVNDRVNGEVGGGADNNTNDKIIAPRDYQLDLLEKAKEMNAIVYQSKVGIKISGMTIKINLKLLIIEY